MQNTQITVKAGTSLKITFVDKKGYYVTQMTIYSPEDVTSLGKKDIITYYFGEVHKIVDCS